MSDTAGEPDLRDAYFSLDRVLDIAIEMAPEDWDTLRHQTRTIDDVLGKDDCFAQPFDSPFSWFPAQVTVDGDPYAEVGVRKKGFFGSLNDEKPSLKLRFDRYVDDQLLDGVMERMTLNNSIQDVSMINTCLAYSVFADAGLATPRCNFATVSVNGEQLGLFVHLEDIKSSMLEHRFANPLGNLYEGTMADFLPDWRGAIEKKTNEDAADWSDIDAIVAALEDPSPAGLQALESAIDLDSFLTFWATEVLVGHWDGYAGDRNNYYVYHEPGALPVFMPWGVDSVFETTDLPFPLDNIESPPSVLAHGAIPNRLYGDDTMRPAYVNRLKELLDTVWDEEELLQRADALAAVVQEHTLPGTREATAADADRVRRFIRERRAEILADLKPEPPAWPWPVPSASDFCLGERAAFESGEFDLRFESAWGSIGSENPLMEGTVDFTRYLLDDMEPSVQLAGAIAGLASAQEAADIGLDDAALITIVNLGETFTIDGFTLWAPVEQVTGGANLVIGEDGVGGAYFSVPLGGEQPDKFVPIDAGGVELDTAGTEPGAVITGRFYGAMSGAGIATQLERAKPAADAGLVINEVTAKGDPSDWVEIYNATDAPIMLGGFLVADDLNDANKRVAFPSDLVIAPGAYLRVPLEKGGWAGFGLGGDEELGLWTTNGLLVDFADWDDGQAGGGGSFARIPDITGNFQAVSEITPGAPN